MRLPIGSEEVSHEEEPSEQRKSKFKPWSLNHGGRSDESAMFKSKQGSGYPEEGVSRQRELSWRTKVTAGT